MMTMEMWLLLATGFTGAFTLRFVARLLAHLFVAPPAVEVRITHGADSLDGLLKGLTRARREILVMARSFSALPVAKALVAAKLRGVKVEILLDPACERDRESDLSFLLAQGLQPLTVAPNAIGVGAVFVVDGRTVYAGGFSSPAELGDDTSADLLCIAGYPQVAAAYRLHFGNEKSDARPAENKPAVAAAATSRPALSPAPAAPLSSFPSVSRPPAAPVPEPAPTPRQPAPSLAPASQRFPLPPPPQPSTTSIPPVPPLPAALTPAGSAPPTTPATTTPATTETPVRKVA